MDAGENAYAYNVGLRDDSKANTPLIASAFSEKVGVYSTDPMKYGGVWGGGKCVVIFCDGSGYAPKLEQPDKCVIDGREVFAAGPTMNFVNPKKPKVTERPEPAAAE